MILLSEKTFSHVNSVSVLWVISLLIGIPTYAGDACPDRDAITASDKLASSYFQDGKSFELGRVLKKHSPSKDKEVASYIQTGDKYYSIFTLVNIDCQARFMKRSRQDD